MIYYHWIEGSLSWQLIYPHIQLYYIKMKICYDQGCNGIGVVIATKSRYYLFYLQQCISALRTVLPKSFTGAFSSNSGLDIREV